MDKPVRVNLKAVDSHFEMSNLSFLKDEDINDLFPNLFAELLNEFKLVYESFNEGIVRSSQIKHSLHQIKGTAGCYGFTKLVEQIQVLQNLDIKINTVKFKSLLDETLNYFKNVSVELNISLKL